MLPCFGLNHHHHHIHTTNITSHQSLHHLARHQQMTDVYAAETYKCPDGTIGCPVVGTFGSWGFYVLGIFMACVFLLGPKTSFGQSELNPSYWLHLLLIAKKTGAKCTWYDPVADKVKERYLNSNDIRLWFRFFMSFLINGVGFHILVHALPVQVASQNTLTGVVLRAVGMMYLVDLDDTPGYTLTLVEEKKPKRETVSSTKHLELLPDELPTPSSTPTRELHHDSDNHVSCNGNLSNHNFAAKSSTTMRNTRDVSDEAARIIEDAKSKLDALARQASNDDGGITNKENILSKHYSKRVAGLLALPPNRHPNNNLHDGNKAEKDIEGNAGDTNNDKGDA